MKRIRLLSAGRILALVLFLSVALALAVLLLFRHRRIEQEQTRPKLQGKVVAVFNNTRYAHEVHGLVRFVLTSKTDTSYEDGTHKLEGVTLESFGTNGDRHDVVTADRADVSNPADLDKLDAEFISNVVVKTMDGLTVKSDYFKWRQNTNTVETDKLVEFEGRNFSGKALGLYLEAESERAHLLHAVDVTIQDRQVPDAADQEVDARQRGDKVKAKILSPEEDAARRAEKKRRRQARKEARRKARSAQLQTKGANGESKGSRNKPGPAPDLTGASKKPTRIRAESAWLEKKEHRVTLEQNVIVSQEANEARSDHMVAYTDASNHIEHIEARGNSYLKQEGRATLTSPDMDFYFGPAHQLVKGVAVGGVESKSLGEGPEREAHSDRMEATFVEGEHGSVADTLTATGNAVVKVHAPMVETPTNPTERELNADAIALQFHPDGRNIKTAEATGNAVLTVMPVRAEPKADKKIIRAPKMTAIFFDEGNKIKSFSGTGGVRVEIDALLAGQHEPRISTSKRLDATFAEDSQDIDRASQEGDFKYVEGDRNAVAERASYDGQKEILQLRGRRPMAWDSTGRTQADEIDYDRGNDETHARGDVRTTYYSRETAGDSTPFSNTKSPVFITAENADAKNKDGIAVYTLNARGWQDDNFVKADRIELYQHEKRMVATGHVESALYQVKKTDTTGPAAGTDGDRDEQPAKTALSKKEKRKAGSKRKNDNQETVPGFAWADRMTYSDDQRLVHYDGSVKARHGTDYLEANDVDVFLKQETNEVDHLNASGNVVLTQPGRKGTGDHLAYTSDDGRAVLTGRTARVEDAENGSTMGSQLTFYSRDDKIAVENQQGTGRVRTTHKMTKH
jgi:LPS export ABC transporter protein LptC/lipopolysaccharide transport protein LptA